MAILLASLSVRDSCARLRLLSRALYRSNELSDFRGLSRCVVGSVVLLFIIIPVLRQLCNIRRGVTEVITRICEWSCLSRSSESALTAGLAGLTARPGYPEWVEGLGRFHI